MCASTCVRACDRVCSHVRVTYGKAGEDRGWVVMCGFNVKFLPTRLRSRTEGFDERIIRSANMKYHE